MKIIIDNKGDISEIDAISYIVAVIKQGRISEAKGIKHFCWLSRFADNIVVATRQKKSINSPDSFVVYKESN